MTKPTIAVIYCRTATTPTNEGNSLVKQEKQCRAFAKAHRMKIKGVFCDPGISGLKEDRDGWQDMMQCLQKTAAPHSVLVVDETRLARDNHLSGALQHECKQLGHTVIIINDGSAKESDGHRKGVKVK